MAVHVSDAPAGLRSTYAAPHCTAHGPAQGELFHPEGYTLWRVSGEISAGTRLEWSSDHGDEALFTLHGMLEIDGTRVDGEAAIIIEAGVAAVLQAHADTRLLHFGPAATAPPQRGLLGAADDDGRSVHVITPEDAGQAGGHDGPLGRYFSDGSCRTCRIAFFLVDGSSLTDGYRAPSHTHSQDEIIHVLHGTLQVGPNEVAAGMSIAVPADFRYGFQTSGPFRFLTYRPDVATFTIGRASEQLAFTETVDEVRRLFGSPSNDVSAPVLRHLRIADR